MTRMMGRASPATSGRTRARFRRGKLSSFEEKKKVTKQSQCRAKTETPQMPHPTSLRNHVRDGCREREPTLARGWRRALPRGCRAAGGGPHRQRAGAAPAGRPAHWDLSKRTGQGTQEARTVTGLQGGGAKNLHQVAFQRSHAHISCPINLVRWGREEEGEATWS